MNQRLMTLENATNFANQVVSTDDQHKDLQRIIQDSSPEQAKKSTIIHYLLKNVDKNALRHKLEELKG